MHNDLKTDVQEFKDMAGKSEQARDKLHEQIRGMVQSNTENAEANKTRQDELIADIASHNKTIQEQRDLAHTTH